MPAGKKSEWQTFQSQLPPCVFQLVVNKLIRNSPSCSSAALTIAGIFRQEKVFIPSWYCADSKRQLFFYFPANAMKKQSGLYRSTSSTGLGPVTPFRNSWQVFLYFCILCYFCIFGTTVIKTFYTILFCSGVIQPSNFCLQMKIKLTAI